MAISAWAVPCLEYDGSHVFPAGFYIEEAAHYHAIASADGLVYACLIDGFAGSYPRLICLELGTHYYEPPIQRSNLGLPTTSSRTLLIDEYAVMAMGNLGLGVVLISNPDQMIGPFITATSNVCRDIARLGSDHLVTAEWSALSVYDIQNPLAPQEISWVSIAQARTVTVVDGLAFLACGNLGLGIVDVSNPSSPQFLIQYPVGGFVDQIAAEGSRVYLTGYLVGLVVVDVSTPSSPSVVTTMPLEGELESIAIRDGYAYMVVDDPELPGQPVFDHMVMVCLNEPQLPYLVGYFFPSENYSSLSLGDDLVFLGEFEDTADIVVAPLQCPRPSDVPGPAAVDLSLSTPWPNPFNPRVNLMFNLPEGVTGQLRVFDLRGRLVAEIWRGTGTGRETRVWWNGTDVTGRACPSGAYGFTLSDQTGGYTTRVTGTLLR